MIRGQGAKTAFAVRDIKMYEDGFIQTQSDGLSRLDIHDPWFMRSVEVTRGASSSLYDNYALGGMVHFRTRRGSDINGFETFLSGGSYGYHKQAFAITVDERHLFAFAGLWEAWKAPEGERVEGYTILTTDANPTIAKVHDRKRLVRPPS